MSVSKEFTTMYCGTFGLYGSIKEERRTDLGGGSACGMDPMV